VPPPVEAASIAERPEVVHGQTLLAFQTGASIERIEHGSCFSAPGSRVVEMGFSEGPANNIDSPNGTRIPSPGLRLSIRLIRLFRLLRLCVRTRPFQRPAILTESEK